MTEPLNRDEILALLERLGAAADAEALAAARALHAAVTDAGIAWDDLLVSEDEGDDGNAAEAEDVETGEPAAAPVPGGKTDRDAAALALIKKFLARPGITEAFRDEMEGYKADIAKGTFADEDHRYLSALDKRLSGKG